MIIIRPIKKSDFAAFEALANIASTGMTNLPKNHSVLERKINESLLSFSKHLDCVEQENYLFLLENSETSEIGGTCAIISKTGLQKPLHFFKTRFLEKNGMKLLDAVSYTNAPSEICALYLKPEFRKEGWGRLLSLSRFMFMAAFPTRFDDLVFAEMRGFISKENRSPFWEAIGQHFLDIDYVDLMDRVGSGLLDYRHVIPDYPLYVSLLPKEVQEIIGTVHPSTKPALNMLLQQGFVLTGEVDLFDAGPRIEAKTAHVHTIKESLTGNVASITHTSFDAVRYIISNERLDFRACYGQLHVPGNGQIYLSPEMASGLEVKLGDLIRYIPST